MIRLVYLIHAFYNPTGMERVLAQKANFLAATGEYDITVVTSRQRDLPRAFSLDPRIKFIDIGANFYSLFGSVIYRLKLERLLRDINPDIVDSLCAPMLSNLQKWRFPGVKMAEFHFSHHCLFLPVTRRSVALRFQKRVSSFASFAVLTKEDMEDWKPYADNLIQIYNPCVLEGHAPLKNRNVALIGRLTVQKNIPDAIRAWSIVASRHHDWTLDIYGEGPLRSEIESLIRESSLEGKVILHGIVDDIHERMLASSAVLLTSDFEGQPLSLLEGISLGLPAISYDCKCGPSEIIRDGVNGFLVRQGDYRTLAERICTIIADEKLRVNMGAAAFESSKRFRLEHIMAQWDELFRRLVGK